MMVGLLFAIAELEDEPGRLVATAPFGGVTLIEYQARLLAGMGISQVVVVVGRVTPALTGAITRIGQRGIAVDTVRSAVEAVARLHPLARVLMLADGLLTTHSAIQPLAGDSGDTLLVANADGAGQDWERLGGGVAWAGAARLDPRRLEETARLPADYDLQSTLLRVAEQAGASHLPLPGNAASHGHGIERRGVALAERGRRVAISLVGSRRSWFDRWIVAPIARVLLPPLLDRQTPSGVPLAVGAGAGVAGLALVAIGWWASGIWLALAGCVAATIGGVLATLRDEEGSRRFVAAVEAGIPAMGVLLLGLEAYRAGEGDGAAIVAFAGVVAAVLAQRSVATRDRRTAWGTPSAYLFLVALFTVIGWPVAGLVIAALYATVTLALAIERLRRPA